MLRYIRNDDVAADTSLDEIRTFCEICDRYNVKIIHAITPIGNVRPIHVSMDNATIRRVSGTDLFVENEAVVEYLKSREEKDHFAVHGFWHTHEPTFLEVNVAYELLVDGMKVDYRRVRYFVPPFNEGNYEGGAGSHALIVLGAGIPRIEDYLDSGNPQADIMYTHSWRFHSGPFSWPMFESCLKRLTAQS